MVLLMRSQLLMFGVVGSVVLALVLLTPVRVNAQEASDQWSLPRTVDGHPDLQGVWANNNATPLERPTEWMDKDRLTDEELAELQRAAADVVSSGNDAQFGDQLVLAALAKIKDADSYDTTGNYNQFWLVDRDFTNQTSLVVDPPNGRIPELTVAAVSRSEARQDYRRDHPADGPEDRPLGERCANFGVPRIGAGYNSYLQIFQARDNVVVLKEMAHDAKVIALDETPHVADGIRQWNGDSRGRWEGDTLVVETTNFSPKSRFRESAENLHLVERYTRVGPDTLNYEVTVTDPTTWTKPWTLMIPLRGSNDAMYEYACHEGNYGMEGILSGHRAQERVAEQAEAK